MNSAREGAILSDIELANLSALVAGALGLDFPRSRWSDLQRGVLLAADALKFADPHGFVDVLVSPSRTREQLETLASYLAVGETYFFREPRSFEALSREILPELIRARSAGERRLRIWSAACCTGEEPYSIAIALQRAIPNWRDWNITILATDINPRFLRKAEAGVFGKWSFRGAPPWLQSDYFHAGANGHFEIAPHVKRMVHFAPLNLAEDVYPALSNDTNAMDVIFCRNVLMYFTPTCAHLVLEKFHRAQMEGGWLLVSPTELPHLSGSPYKTTRVGGAIVFRKDSHAAPRASRHVDVPQLVPSDLQPPLTAPASPTTPLIPDAYKEAVELYEIGRFDEGISVLDSAPAGSENTSQHKLLAARCWANQGRLAEALHCCDDAIAADKLNPGSHYLRAMILQERGELDEANRSLLRTLYLDSRFALAHFALGNIAAQRGQPRQARAHFRHALGSIDSQHLDQTIAESDGLTAQRFTEILRGLLSEEKAA